MRSLYSGAVVAAVGCLSLVAAAVVPPATAMAAAATTDAATTAVVLPPVPQGEVTVADNGTLRMDVDMTHGSFEIVDERNGAVWTSGPNDPASLGHNPYWKGVLRTQFGLYATDTERLAPTTTEMTDQYGDQFPTDLTVSRITNGVAFTYKQAIWNITFEADVTIDGDQMVATVPSSKVFEDELLPDNKSHKQVPLGTLGCSRYPPPPPTMTLLFYFPPECYMITDIAFLPAFGLGLPGQDGYVVVPDGSGAEIDFNKVHPTYTNEYDAPVYGDPTTTPFRDDWLPEANMPVFGIVHGDSADPAKASAMLATITEGADNAEIVVIPAGQRANGYMASVKFTYRPVYQEFFGVGNFTSTYSWAPVTGDRQVTYTFVNGASANYSGLAQTYRNYLVQQQNVKPLQPQPKTPLLLHVFNGIRETGVLFSPFEKSTTFSQTEQMLKSLEKSGVSAIRATLEGWMADGYVSNVLPKIWPPAGQLGGTAGLKSLSTYAKANNVQLVLATDVFQAFTSSNGFNPRKDAMHQESQIIFQEGGAYLIAANFAQNKLFPPLDKKMSDVGVAGVDFDYVGRNVYPNYTKKDVLTRGQSITDWMSMVNSARTSLGSAGVQGGNLYALGSADYFYNAPTDDSGFNYESKAIPFWEIAVHGLALYSGLESNLRSSPVQQELQMIDFGALPAWEMTWQTASTLRFTYYDYLYSSDFASWGPKAVAEYQQEQSRGYAALAYVAIDSNEAIQPGVDVTDYANGAHVIVNYNTTPVTLPQYQNVTVPAQDYAVVSGGGSQ